MNHVIKHLAAQPGMSESYIASLFDDWEAHDYVVNGESVGTAMTKGTEIHFAVDPSHRKRWMLRKNLREFLRPMFEKLGFLTTKVLVGSEFQSKFVERIGFEKTWSDGRFNYYLLANLPYERKAK